MGGWATKTTMISVGRKSLGEAFELRGKKRQRILSMSYPDCLKNGSLYIYIYWFFVIPI